MGSEIKPPQGSTTTDAICVRFHFQIMTSSIQKTIFFEQDPLLFSRFEKIAKLLAEATLGIPEAYRGNFGSCLIAVDIGYRLNVSPILVLQNTREVNGQPYWSYQFVKAIIESSGLFKGPLRYEIEGTPSNDGSDGSKPYRVRAVATNADDSLAVGQWITWQMASIEGWTDNVSYTSMPETMFKARATTFFGNQYCSSLLMGVQVDMDAQSQTPKQKPATTTGPTLLCLPEVECTQKGISVFSAALAQATTAVVLPSATSPGSEADSPAASPMVPMDKTGNGGQPTESSGDPLQTPSSPEPKVRRPRQPKVTTQAGEDSQPGTSKEVNSTPGTSETNAEAGSLTESGQEPNDAQTAATQTGLNVLQESIDRFSSAFAFVDATNISAQALQQAWDLIKTFQKDERDDLYLVLFGNVEKHLVSLTGRDESLSKNGAEFATLVRQFHTETKDVIAENKDLADKRAAMGNAYRNLLTHLSSKKAPQTS